MKKHEQIQNDQEDKVVHIKDAIRTTRFYHLAVMLFNGVFFGTYMASVYKSFVKGKIDDQTLTVAGAIGSFINGSSRIFWATL